MSVKRYSMTRYFDYSPSLGTAVVLASDYAAETARADSAEESLDACHTAIHALAVERTELRAALAAETARADAAVEQLAEAVEHHILVIQDFESRLAAAERDGATMRSLIDEALLIAPHPGSGQRWYEWSGRVAEFLAAARAGGEDRCPHCSFDPHSLSDYCDKHRPRDRREP